MLEVQEDKMLILSENIIDMKPYVGLWAESSLRNDLNAGFLATFSPEDRERIVETKVITGGIETTDKVFFLSLEEVIQYFCDSENLENRLNDMNMHGRDIQDKYNYTRAAANNWWLRSHNFPFRLPYIVDLGGSISGVYNTAPGVHLGVRPALWLNLTQPAAQVTNDR